MTTTTSWGVVIGLSLLLPQTPVTPAQTGPPVPAAAAAPPVPAASPPPRFEIIWRHKIDAAGALGMVLASTVLVTSDSDVGVTARSLADGNQVWTAAYPSRFPPVVAGTLVLVASGGRLFALDVTSGKPRWVVENTGEPTSLLSQGTQIIMSGSTEIRAWHADGTEAWRQTVDSKIVTPAATEGDAVFAGLASKKLVALDAKTGTHRWAIPLETVPTSLLAARGRLYFGGEDGHLYAYLQRPSTDRNWRHEMLPPAVGVPTADDRWLYVAFLDNTVRTFDLTTGNQRWKASIPARPATAPFVVGEQVGVLTTSGDVVLLRRRDGIAVPVSKPAADAKPAVVTRQTLQTHAVSSDGAQIFSLVVNEDGSRTLVGFKYAAAAK